MINSILVLIKIFKKIIDNQTISLNFKDFRIMILIIIITILIMNTIVKIRFKKKKIITMKKMTPKINQQILNK